MTSWFAGIEQAATGLNASRYGLSVVSQNVANAGTPGYTRQISQQQADDASAVTTVNTPRSGEATLGGVTVTATTRADDPVLDQRVRTTHASGSYTSATAATLAGVETLFPEPSGTGLSTQLNDFWSGWSDVSSDPSTRSVLLQKAGTVIGTLHTTSAALTDLADTTSQSLGQDLASANSSATQLATVNGQIAIASAVGANTNSLLDQRDQLLDTLAKTVGAQATINQNGTATVTVGGQNLVSLTSAQTLAVDSAYQVSVGGNAVTLAPSSAAARVTALTTTLPGYQKQLDGVANALETTVNGVQAAGYDAAGNPGQAMFSGSGAAGITLAFSDPSLIAAAATPGASADGSNALRASQLGTSPTGPDAAYTALIGGLGSASALAQQQDSTQQAVVTNVDSMKSSVSAVSVDEELTNMLMYQRAFEASSKVLTTVDSMLDTLINHTGVGG